jgi:hypothetical protein
MSDMLGVIFYEQRSIVTEFGFIEVPLRAVWTGAVGSAGTEHLPEVLPKETILQKLDAYCGGQGLSDDAVMIEIAP